MTDALPRVRGPEDFAAAFDVSRESLDRLQTYAELLRAWQRTASLVSRASLDDVWHRHFADSAQLLDLAPPFASWLDLGSGAGFPASAPSSPRSPDAPGALWKFTIRALNL